MRGSLRFLVLHLPRDIGKICLLRDHALFACLASSDVRYLITDVSQRERVVANPVWVEAKGEWMDILLRSHAYISLFLAPLSCPSK